MEHTQQKESDGNGSRHGSNESTADRMDTFLLGDGTIRGALLHGTRLVEEMRLNHGTGVLETLVLGHAYLAAGLLTSLVKGRDRIALSVECGGPIAGFSVESTASGEVRGYLFQNPIPLEEPLESFDLSLLFGPGFMHLSRILEGSHEPVTGQSMLEHGNLAQDLAQHFTTSEQTPTLFSLSITFDHDGLPTGAGGLFLQSLPGAEDQILERAQALACSMPSLGEWFAQGNSIEDLIMSTFSDLSPEIIGSKEIVFFCPCSRDRFTAFLTALDEETRTSIRHEGPFPLELTCHNCGTSYTFSQEELEAIL